MADRVDITIEQGATFTKTVEVGSAYDGYTARAKVRRDFGGSVIVELTATTVASGETTLSLTATETADIARPANAAFRERVAEMGVFDLELVSGATVVRAVEGKAFHSAEATR